MIDFDALPKDRLDRMAEAGSNILECYRVLQKTNANVVGEILAHQGDFFEWDHFPKGDVYDHESHSQYYYHAHPPEERANVWGPEHGHFHTFLRPKGMPSGIKPASVPDYKKPEGENDALTHFVAVSMDRSGFPIRMFTTNRWVTGEFWYDAENVINMLDCFEMDLAWPSWPVNIWLTDMMRLFRPQIEHLLRQRDERVAEWSTQHPDANVYEDRKLEVTSIVDISVQDQIEGVTAALARKAA